MVTLVNENELAFNREDFANTVSWLKFRNGDKLKESDFVDRNNYLRWFLLVVELVDYAVVIVDGLKGSGKSLFDAWLADKNNKLFNKGVTTNCKLKNTFGEYNLITEQVFLDEWVKLTDLADRDDTNNLIENIGALTKYSMFYNRTILIDEARKWVWRRRPNNRMLQYIGELVDQVRHNHNVMLFSCANAERVVDIHTIWENRTHVVHCSFNTTYTGYATYSILHRNSGKTYWMHLNAADNAYLWDSENLVGMSKPLTKKQLQDAQKKITINQINEKDTTWN